MARFRTKRSHLPASVQAAQCPTPLQLGTLVLAGFLLGNRCDVAIFMNGFPLVVSLSGLKRNGLPANAAQGRGRGKAVLFAFKKLIQVFYELQEFLLIL